jgi:hypothetical protein
MPQDASIEKEGVPDHSDIIKKFLFLETEGLRLGAGGVASGRTGSCVFAGRGDGEGPWRTAVHH